MPLLSRLYVWSILFEPLLFFMLMERTVSGITANVSRILQAMVIIGLILKFLLDVLRVKLVSVRIINVLSPLYVNYSAYFSLVVFAGCFGLLSGAYDAQYAYHFNEGDSGWYQFIDSESIRPIFEYIITLFYFFYFAVLPQYFLKTKKSIDYFFSSFKLVFNISLILGFIDLAFAAMNHPLLPRHIADWRMVGMRFHGLAGEPRDAFVYLFYGLATLHLSAYYKGVRLGGLWITLVLLAAILTQSASGLIGILIFIVLYGVYSLGRSNIRSLVRLCFVLTLVIVLSYVAAISSKRIMMYLESTVNLWNILEARARLPYLMSVQSSNIYPIYDLIVKFRNWNFLPVFIGSGMGSASVINNLYDPVTTTINNPHSQFVRVIFESGLIGVFLFVKSFLSPIKYLTKQLSSKKQHEFILLMLLLLGIFLGHRSSVCFIYLGIFIAAFRVLEANVSQPVACVNGAPYRGNIPRGDLTTKNIPI